MPDTTAPSAPSGGSVSGGSAVTLYPHAPSALLPLLRSELPHSISLLSTILANRHSASDPPVAGALSPPLPSVYATFQSASQVPHAWLVVVALPEPSEQIRFYHSQVDEGDAEAVVAAEARIESALLQMKERYPSQLVAGCTPAMWEPVARSVLGGVRREETFVYLAPAGGFGHTPIDAPPVPDELVLDHGRETDADLIYSLNHYRPREYYAARAGHITVLRRPGGPAEVFVQCHGDGSLGALHTQPAFRRRGLAKAVLAAHLARYEGVVPGYCYIEAHNGASMALFEGLGWTRMPGSFYWVFEKSVQE